MNDNFDYDYIVIGSGFGGSVAALRLVEKGYKVAIIEQGRRWTPDTLPSSTWSLRRWVWRPSLGLRGFFSVSIFRHVTVLHGNAVGGGSITYANVLLVPPDKVWKQGSWANLLDWQRVMPGHYATARRMLGVTTNRILGPADLRLKEMGRIIGVEKSFYPTEVGVFFGNEGDPQGMTCPDPFFSGEGPQRTTCHGCGACMIGCRHGAKNTLDKNYLYLAEKKGAKLYDETRVVDVKPLPAQPGNSGKNDGATGYAVSLVGSGSRESRKSSRLTCRGVVFSASSLGTQKLLFRLKQGGSLPDISDALGKKVRTNAESLIGIRYPGSAVDLSQGIAIGSGIYIDEHTHIETTRYPAGSDTMGLLSTIMTPVRPGLARPLVWLATLIGLLVTRPLTTLRMLWPVGYARETMILLCMQTLDGYLDMSYKRRWYWPFSKSLGSEGDPIPACIPAANVFAIKAAKATGGVPATFLPEILFNIPATAHCMGGAAIGPNRDEGVCDGKNRVFGYRNMYICDGSMLGGNLGVNPSLTIAALTEHAMSHVPLLEQQRWNEIGIEMPRPDEPDARPALSRVEMRRGK